MDDNVNNLIEMARNARKKAYAPYSGFKVGAALICDDGTIYTGCNIENISFTPTVCAERTAIFKAISEGNKEFSKISVITGDSKPSPPCGVCRQVLSEFVGPDFEVILATTSGEVEILKFKELFPYTFEPNDAIGDN